MASLKKLFYLVDISGGQVYLIEETFNWLNTLSKEAGAYQLKTGSRTEA